MEVQAPGHVPADRIVQFDYFADPGIADDPRANALRLRGGPGLVYTLNNGGHWIATTAAVMNDMLAQPEVFSSFPYLIPKQVSSPTPRPFAEIDAPDHGKYRALLAPLTNPKLIAGFEADVRNLMVELIEAVYAKGGCEFHVEIGQKFPIFIIMKLLGLPPQDRDMLIDLTDKVINAADPEVRRKARDQSEAYVSRKVAERRGSAGDDLISAIVNGQIDGRAVTDAEAIAMVTNLVHGGLDTVRANMTFMAHFLATHDDHRRQLARDPSLIPNAVDELLRWLSLPSLARCVKRDIEFHGVHLKAGDQILMPFVLGSCDEAVHQNALLVDFTRGDTKSLTFSGGPHFCPGRAIARLELRIFLEEWMRRIPEFRLATGSRAVGTGGVVAGLRNVQLRWDVQR